MQWRIVDISGTGKYLFIERGFLKVSQKDKLLGSVGLDDLLGVIVSGHGHTVSVSCLNRLAKHNISLIFCENNQMPFSYCFPVAVLSEQSKRMISQLQAKEPVKKRLWKKIIEKKIIHQAYVANILNLDCENKLLALSKKVKSGDTTNRESVAARIYWQELFGKTFRRDRQIDGINSLLNYGYVVLRACVARAIMGAGLHPTLGIHHRGPMNSMCLIDDTMEPFRPIIDYIVWNIYQKGIDEIDQEAKSILASFAIMDIKSERGTSPLSSAIFRMANSLSKIFQGEEKKLFIPEMPRQDAFKKFFG